eukprot:SAG11_NODE_729_length_7489_cov_17.662246_4_plen_45_part_00
MCDIVEDEEERHELSTVAVLMAVAARTGNLSRKIGNVLERLTKA